MGKYRCDNCEFEDEEDDLPDAKELSMRLTPGGKYTDKECPKCHALCFPIEEEDGKPDQIPPEMAAHDALDQLTVNQNWLMEKFDLLHDMLCPDKTGTWQQRVEQVHSACIALKEQRQQADYGKIACKNCLHPLEDHDPENDRCTKCACAGFEVDIRPTLEKNMAEEAMKDVEMLPELLDVHAICDQRDKAEEKCTRLHVALSTLWDEVNAVVVMGLVNWRDSEGVTDMTDALNKALKKAEALK